MLSCQGRDLQLNISVDTQHLKLLEVPPKLLGVITANAESTIWLKSNSVTEGGESSHDSATLCTRHQAYKLRQVQSSNSLLVIRPHLAQGSAEEGESGLLTIAECVSTLELVPSNLSAIDLLCNTLPLYKIEKDVSDLEVREPRNKDQVLNQLVVPQDEAHLAWKALCAFEVQEQSWRPDVTVLVQVWKSVMTAIDLRSLDPEQPLLFTALDPTVEEDGFPTSLLEAILSRIGGVSIDETSSEKAARLNKDVCVAWVGELLNENLELRALGSAMFLQEWRNLLPEAWKTQARLDILSQVLQHLLNMHSNAHPNRHQQDMDHSNIAGTKQPSTTAINASSSAKGRRWHEKFKGGRK